MAGPEYVDWRSSGDARTVRYGYDPTAVMSEAWAPPRDAHDTRVPCQAILRP